MNTSLRIRRLAPLLFSILAVLTLAIVLPACGDKTIDEYRQHRVDQENGRIQAIAGNYRGLLTANRDGLALGSLSIEISPDTHLQKSSDGLSSEPQAVVQGTLSYDGVFRAQLVFSEGYYDDKNGTFKASITIRDELGNDAEITVSGKIDNSQFNGNLESEGHPEFGGKFSLLRNGPAPEAQHLISGRAQELLSETMKFVGSYELNGQQYPFRLELLQRQVTPEQVFLKIFNPTRGVKVICDFDKIQVSIDDAHMDDRSESKWLLGQTAVSDGSARYPVSIECKRNLRGNEIANLDCVFTGARQQKIHLIVTPESQGGGR